MIRNYLKVALRNLLRHKEYNVINIFGLAVGIACCILIMVFVRSEFSYDAFHANADRIYRAWQYEKADGQEFINTVTPLPMGGALKSSYPEVEAFCRVYSFNPLVKVEEKSFKEDVRMVDSGFFTMFSFKLLEGNPANPFSSQSSILLTQETAKKYFGNTNAIGKSISMELGDQKMLFTVSGILQAPPAASSIKYHALISYDNARYMFRPRMFSSWFNVFTETYVLLKPGVNVAALQKKFPAMLKQQLGEDYGSEEFKLNLQPIKDIHLNTALPAANEPISDPKYSYILATIGILILLVACINFITLSIGRSASRAMEVGVRKVLGAERQQLIRQFWGEAFLLTVISVCIGLGLAAFLIKPFDALINRELQLQFDFTFILFCLLMVAAIAIIAGIYPAVILSGFKPVEVLKGKLKIKGDKGWLRQSLVVGQFTASIIMIVCTLVIGEQMQYLQSKDLGYKKDQVLVVETNKPRKEGLQLAQLYRTELLKHTQVTDAAVSIYSFAQTPWVNLGYADENKVYKNFQYNAIDPNFIPAMKIPVVSGRNFQEGNSADLTGAAIVNETFVKAFGLKDPVGKKMPGPFTQQIIGVVKDFNFESLHTDIRPLVMSLSPDTVLKQSQDVSFNAPPQPRISVRLKQGDIAASVDLLKSVWNTVAPGQDFDYHFLDETIAAQYAEEKRSNAIVNLASLLSVFIACMGLFGLATLSVTRRIKEIGIRKVLGASVGSIVQLLSKGFLKLVVIASVIASPVAWWAMNSWLKDFAYRVNIEWWIFFAAGCIAVLIAFLTVSFHAVKAAVVNPVKSLKSE